MVEHQWIRCRDHYLDIAIFQPSKIKLILENYHKGLFLLHSKISCLLQPMIKMKFAESYQPCPSLIKPRSIYFSSYSIQEWLINIFLISYQSYHMTHMLWLIRYELWAFISQKTVSKTDKNRMTAGALAVVVGPSLFRVQATSEGLQTTQKTNEVAMKFIKDYQIFRTEFSSESNSIPSPIINKQERIETAEV